MDKNKNNFTIQQLMMDYYSQAVVMFVFTPCSYKFLQIVKKKTILTVSSCQKNMFINPVCRLLTIKYKKYFYHSL